jgi:ubiquinone/menaquinone biosynthesis C-methylase UbiE
MLSHFQRFRAFLSAGKILDIGCGTGKDAALFLSAGYEYAGIDASDGMLAIARQALPQADFRKLDMREIGKEFASKSFDGFWAAASLFHVPKKDIADVLRQIALVVKSGGMGLIVLKEGDGEEVKRGNIIKGERFFALYRQGEFAKILENNGFKIVAWEADLHKCHAPDYTIWNMYFVEVL